jgi:hypothetical protein
VYVHGSDLIAGFFSAASALIIPLIGAVRCVLCMDSGRGYIHRNWHLKMFMFALFESLSRPVFLAKCSDSGARQGAFIMDQRASAVLC